MTLERCFSFCRVVLPGLGAVAAGSRWGDLCVTGQGPGVWRRLQLLHVAPEQGEKCCGGVGRLLAALALQQLHQEVDVAHGQAQDLILAQLLLWRVGGDELAELCEGGVHVVLAPALPGVGEHLPGHGAEWGCKDQPSEKLIRDSHTHSNGGCKCEGWQWVLCYTCLRYDFQFIIEPCFLLGSLFIFIIAAIYPFHLGFLYDMC